MILVETRSVDRASDWVIPNLGTVLLSIGRISVEYQPSVGTVSTNQRLQLTEYRPTFDCCLGIADQYIDQVTTECRPICRMTVYWSTLDRGCLRYT